MSGVRSVLLLCWRDTGHPQGGGSETYLQRIGINKSYEPAALAVISFIITWGAMGMIQLLARFAPKTARS